MIVLKEKADCCGCTACYSACHHGAITLVTDQEGFVYPEFDKTKCVECGLCDSVCPVLKYKAEPKEAKPACYAVLNKDEQEYLSSSSGGVFIALCKWAIANGYIVYGASYEENFVVRHTYARTLDECKKFQGSKYVQSDTRGIFPEIRKFLNDNQPILFSGTPCQVAALKAYLRKDYDQLFTVDILCHGVPSPNAFQQYLSFVKGKDGIISINMKSKSETKGTAIRIDYINGRSIRGTLKINLWSKLYFSNLVSRPSCHKCQFTHYNRPGDLSIGDYWGASKHYPYFHPEKMVSLVLANNKNGQKIFDILSNKFDYIRVSKEKTIQNALKTSVKAASERDKFWSDLTNSGFKYISRKYLEYTCFNLLKEKVRRLLSPFK